MSMLGNLTPDQRQMLLYGAPVVAGVALISTLRGKKPAEDVRATGMTLPTMPSSDAIGVGQLAEFESQITNALIGVQQSIYDLENRAVNTPVTPPTGQTPAPVEVPGTPPVQVVPSTPITPTHLPAYPSTPTRLPSGARVDTRGVTRALSSTEVRAHDARFREDKQLQQAVASTVGKLPQEAQRGLADLVAAGYTPLQIQEIARRQEAMR